VQKRKNGRNFSNSRTSYTRRSRWRDLGSPSAEPAKLSKYCHNFISLHKKWITFSHTSGNPYKLNISFHKSCGYPC
jgi:hypothetical protein